jgi:hypothetical protein
MLLAVMPVSSLVSVGAPLYSNFWKLTVETGHPAVNFGLVFFREIEYNINCIMISDPILFERKVLSYETGK